MHRLVLLLLALATTLPAQQTLVHKDGFGRDYWVYAPSRPAPGKPLWLVVGVHGMGGTGQGAGGLSGWASRRDDCLVVGPTFPSRGYQFLAQESDTQLIRLIAELGKAHRLHPKVFLAGFSGGAQFAHRFAHAHPERVLAVAAHSGGSWSTGGQWGEINPAARLVPMLVTCGEADTAKMAAAAPLGRLEWARDYARRLVDGGFVVAEAYPAGIGHRFSPEAERLSLELFEFASSRAAAMERQRAELAELVAKGDLARARQAADRARVATASVVPTRPRDRWEQSLARAHNAAIDQLLGKAGR